MDNIKDWNDFLLKAATITFLLGVLWFCCRQIDKDTKT